MDSFDLAALVPRWRSGKDSNGIEYTPTVQEGLRLAADELEAVLSRRYTLGTEVRHKDSGNTGEIVGAYRTTRLEPIIYVADMTGGDRIQGTRFEFEALGTNLLPEIDPLGPDATREHYQEEVLAVAPGHGRHRAAEAGATTGSWRLPWLRKDNS